MSPLHAEAIIRLDSKNSGRTEECHMFQYDTGIDARKLTKKIHLGQNWSLCLSKKDPMNLVHSSNKTLGKHPH